MVDEPEAPLDISPEDLALLEDGEQIERDPFLLMELTKVQREFIRWIHDPRDLEVYWRSGNQGAKTAGGARVAVALCRRLENVCGCPLPVLERPVVGWVLTQSYKQQVDASQAAVLEVLGNWPHHISYVAGETKGYIETVHIATDLCKHGMGEHCELCSRLVFHCEESKSSVGGRISFAWADEPPDQGVWDEIRGRTKANQRLPLFITATPLDSGRWWWLREDFPPQCLVYATHHITQDGERFGEPFLGRAEIRSTIFDNEFLSSAHIQRQLERWGTSNRFIKARTLGEYVDSVGDCPFDLGRLDRWASRCKPGRHTKVIATTQVDREDGQIIVHVAVEPEIWYDREEDEDYLLIADLSSGIKARGNDPACLHVWARRRPRLVARFNGFLDPYGMGSLSAILARRYNSALVDPEMNSGWGKPFLAALAFHQYSNINRDVDPDKPGYVNVRLGFRSSNSSKGQLVGAIQQALVEDSVEILSADVIHQLAGVAFTVTDKGAYRYEASKGKHDEDFICAGRAIQLIYQRPLKPKPRADDVFAQVRRPKPPRPPQPLWHR